MPATDAVRHDERLVVGWIDAINGLDLEAALACLHPDVELRPLRLGLDAAYRGHDGVRDWFAGLARLPRRHAVVLTDVRRTGDGGLRAAGALGYPGQPDVAPFCGVYRLTEGLIVVARHYLSDADLVERILGPSTPPPA